MSTRILIMLLALIVGSHFSAFSQKSRDSTVRKKTPFRISTSTNSETLVKETKIEYFSENGSLRREEVLTRDLDGNSVKRIKTFDKTETVKEKIEVRQDENKNLIYYEYLEYDDKGRVKTGIKQIKDKDGKWLDFPFDADKQQFGEGVPMASNKPVDVPDNIISSPLGCSSFFLHGGYSYLRVLGEDGFGMGLGAELGGGYRVSDNVSLVLNASVHKKSENGQRWSMVYLLGGVQYEFGNCEDEGQITPFGRALAGIVHDKIKAMDFKSTEDVFLAGAGAGVYVPIGGKSKVRLNVDWMASFFNGDVQHNLRLGAGFQIDFAEKLRSVLND